MFLVNLFVVQGILKKLFVKCHKIFYLRSIGVWNTVLVYIFQKWSLWLFSFLFYLRISFLQHFFMSFRDYICSIVFDIFHDSQIYRIEILSKSIARQYFLRLFLVLCLKNLFLVLVMHILIELVYFQAKFSVCDSISRRFHSFAAD